MKPPHAILCWFILATTATAGDDITINRIFGQEIPGKYKHPACMTQLANGDYYLVYYCGTGEYATDTAVYGSRRKKGKRKWSYPVVISDTPFTSDGNSVIWQAPDGVVWLFHVVRYGETWSTSRIVAKISRDNGKTWSDTVMLTFQEGTMVRSHPIVLKDGDYLLPIYHETGANTEWLAADSASLFLRRDIKSGKWTPTNEIHSRIGNIQPSVVQINDHDLIAYCRRGGGYEPTKDGWLVRSESHDGGRTWSEGKDSTFPNPNAAVDFIKLSNGHLLLVYNDSMNDRNPLTAAISTDNDKSYPCRRNIIDDPKGDFGYPTAIEAQDGKIHVMFTSDERTVIREAIFEESAILR